MLSTQPLSPLALRTRLQSSGGGAFAAWLSALDCATSGGVFDSSFQFRGGGGGAGIGGSGYFCSDFLRAAGGVLGRGGINGLRAGGVRGALTCATTSTFSPSLTCRKLGEKRLGSVCTFSRS